MFIFVLDEERDAETIKRVLKTANGGFTILRGIIGVHVKARRVTELSLKQVYLFLSDTPA